MSEPLTSDLIVELRSEAQNEYMIDQYYLPTGKLLNRAADEIERLCAALADQVRREETARCVRCGCAAFICGAEIAAQPEETTEACALSVSPSALQGTNPNDISTLDGTQDALRMRCSTS